MDCERACSVNYPGPASTLTRQWREAGPGSRSAGRPCVRLLSHSCSSSDCTVINTAILTSTVVVVRSVVRATKLLTQNLLPSLVGCALQRRIHSETRRGLLPSPLGPVPRAPVRNVPRLN